jgi:hypothetical protein
MNSSDAFAAPLTADNLQLYKPLAPLPSAAMDELERIEALNVTDFTEAEVRAFVIDPIVRLLGYEKGSRFSVDLERKLTFLGKNKFPDYKLNLWEEDFWLIEAKRPRPLKDAFGYPDIAQAMEYASHPDINAALVVLCDGRKFEVFDREVSMTEPVLRVLRSELRQKFDRIRLLLEPWQVWFFQKRRIARLIDKVFDKEFNLGRMEEFRSLINRRLDSKRLAITENFRKNIKPNSEIILLHLANAPTEELVDVHMLQSQTIESMGMLIRTLVDRSNVSSFKTVFRIFPDHPRDANTHFWMHAAAYLFSLVRVRETVEFCPAWLSPGQQANVRLDHVIKRLIRACLTHFRADEARRCILLAESTLRRIFKVFLLSSNASWSQARALHFMHRFQTDELTWEQIIASPEHQALSMIDGMTSAATRRFMEPCQTQDRGFKVEVAKLQLRDLWRLELSLLESIGDYRKLREERNLSELYPTESVDVSIDWLGHSLLCLLEQYPEWTDHILTAHGDEVRFLATQGSWAARALVESSGAEEFPRPTDESLAEQFFLGDLATHKKIRQKYQGK